MHYYCTINHSDTGPDGHHVVRFFDIHSTMRARCSATHKPFRGE